MLDTTVISRALRGDKAVRAYLMKLPRAGQHICSVIVAELEYGSLRSPNPEHHRARWRRFVTGLIILPFDADAAVTHARLRQTLRQKPIGERDLMIASIAVTHHLGLLTGNLDEFKRVKGLRSRDCVR